MPLTAAKIEFLEKTAREMQGDNEMLSLSRNLLVSINGRERETGISFRIPREGRFEKVAGGLPLVSPADICVCTNASSLFLLLLIDTIKEAGGTGDEHLECLAASIKAGRFDLRTLFRDCLGGERQRIDHAAAAIAVPAHLLHMILETTLRTALERLTANLPGEAYPKVAV